MSVDLGSATLTVNVPGIFNNAPPMGVQGIIIANESPFNVAIAMQGTAISGTLLPETVDFYPVVRGFNGNITYSPTSVITNPASYTAASLSFKAVGLNENINLSAYPIALTRPAVTATASGAPLFSATFGIQVTVTAIQTLNVFNPSNSGVTYTFHSARCFTNDNSVPAANLVLISGADLNLGTAVSAISHIGTGTPPTSTAHCTAEDTNTSHGGTIIEVLEMQQNETQDFLSFPDNFTLQPGNNLRIALTSNAGGHVVRLTMKWSEAVTATVPTGVKMNILTAANIVNDGNSAGTGIIESTVSGDTSSAVLLTNDAQLTLGDAAHAAVVTLKGTLNFAAGSITRMDQQHVTPSVTTLVTYSHNLGAVPDLVIPVYNASTSGFTVSVKNFTSTTFDMIVSNASHLMDILLIKF